MKMNVHFPSTNKMFTNTYLYDFEFFNFLFISNFALQKYSRKLSSCQDNSCIEMKNDSSLYAVGCKSYTLLYDTRTLHTIKKIPTSVLCRGVQKTNFGESTTCSLVEQTISQYIFLVNFLNYCLI